tara:strand:- start:15611 stop:16441 length:831 start_codon:yes stop_codon:yes gene_type:complete
METVTNFLKSNESKLEIPYVPSGFNSIVLGILAFFLLIALIFIAIRFFSKKNMGITLIGVPVEMSPAPKICGNKIVTSDANEYTYSFWTYIKNYWNDGNPKLIFERKYKNYTMYVNFEEGPVMTVQFIDSTTNQPYFDVNQNISKKSRRFGNNNVMNYSLDNIRLQSWNHIAISQWGKTMDFYLNGKLARTFILPFELEPYLPETIIIGGEESETYDGYISQFKYFPRTVSVENIYKMYLKGPQEKSALSSFMPILPSSTLADVNMHLGSGGIWNN